MGRGKIDVPANPPANISSGLVFPSLGFPRILEVDSLRSRFSANEHGRITASAHETRRWKWPEEVEEEEELTHLRRRIPDEHQ